MEFIVADPVLVPLDEVGLAPILVDPGPGPAFSLDPVLVELEVVLVKLKVAAAPGVALDPASDPGLGPVPFLVGLRVVLVELEVAAGPGPAEDIGAVPDVVVRASALDDHHPGIPGKSINDD